MFSFENFLADMGERPLGKTIDRIDPFGNYEPSNCRWASRSEQRINQKRGDKDLIIDFLYWAGRDKDLSHLVDDYLKTSMVRHERKSVK